MSKLITKKRIAVGTFCLFVLLTFAITIAFSTVNSVSNVRSKAAAASDPVRVRTFANEEALSYGLREVVSDLTIQSAQADISQPWVNTDRVLSIETDSFHAGIPIVVHDSKHNDPRSVEPLWDSLAAIQADENNATPFGGSTEKGPQKPEKKASCICSLLGIRWD
ncbi:hypothetical protein LBMAG51_04840 [Phycisphaerae bacterium]|nr:hypothetical protein LBMAG51_04840 [Phycisphaerae bacterium]